MASLKTIERPDNRGVLNTTIKKEILEEFKKNCKIYGVPMNVILEAFMRQFNEGGFYIKLGKESIALDFDENSNQ